MKISAEGGATLDARGSPACATGWLGRVPTMPFFLAVSLLVHVNITLWVGAAQGQPVPVEARRLEVILEREAPALPESASPPAAEPEDRHYVDIPEEKPDEGAPRAHTLKIGIRNLHMRDPEGVESPKDAPRAKGNTEALVVRPGRKGAASQLEPSSPFPAGQPEPAEAVAPEPTPRDDVPPLETPPDLLRPAAPVRRDGDVQLESRHTDTRDAPRQRVARERTTDRFLMRVPGLPYLFALPPGARAEVQRNPEGGAAARGPVQFNVKLDEYASYYKHLFGRIRLAFTLRMRTHYRRPFRLGSPRVITIGFRVTRQGKFEDLGVLKDGGLVLIASDLLDAVAAASPVDPFPGFIKESELHIRVRCYVE